MMEILKIRCEEEDCQMSTDAMLIMSKIASTTSLRYCIQLITTANVISRRRKSPEITKDDVKKVYDLFLDEQRSSRYLNEHQSEFMFNQINDSLSVSDAMEIN